jgi:hypothetical protein
VIGARDGHSYALLPVPRHIVSPQYGQWLLVPPGKQLSTACSYEAWVIYNFMSLCMAYVGGPGAVVVKSEGVLIEPSWALCTCCMAPIPVDGFFLRNCKQGTLQFVIAKPILAVRGARTRHEFDWGVGMGARRSRY